MAFSALDADVPLTGQIACLQSQGIAAVGRYYTRNRSSRKLLQLAEARALSAAGIRIWPVYQDRQNQAADFSLEKGVAAGQNALSYARDVIGQPAGTAIYFAVDFDPSNSQIDRVIEPYFRGIAQALREAGDPYRAGVYGSGLVCKALLDAGLVAYTWLTMSSGFAGTAAFKASGRWHLLQKLEVEGFCNLASVDPDVVNPANPEFGAFLLGNAPVAAIAKAAAAPKRPVAPKAAAVAKAVPPATPQASGGLPVWTSLDRMPSKAETDAAIAMGTLFFDINCEVFSTLNSETNSPDEIQTARAVISRIRERGAKVTLYHEGAGGGAAWGEPVHNLAKAVERKALRADLAELVKLGADYLHIDNVHDLGPDRLEAVLEVGLLEGAQPIIKNNPGSWLELLGRPDNKLAPPYAMIENLVGQSQQSDSDAKSYVKAAKALGQLRRFPVFAVDFIAADDPGNCVSRPRAAAFLANNSDWLTGIYLMRYENPANHNGLGGYDCRPKNCEYLGLTPGGEAANATPTGAG